MSYLKKNDRYQAGCTGSLYFNPRILPKQQLTFSSYSVDEGATIVKVPASILGDGDIISFGGQAVGFVINIVLGYAYINFPEETWPNMEDEEDNVIYQYMNNYDYIYAFRPNYDYAYSFGGTEMARGTAKYPDTCIENVLIKDYSEITKRKTFGFHRQQFDSLTEYHASLEIPPEVDKLKIDQMLNSEAVVFVPDNRIVEVKTMPFGWKFDKPRGGGSMNPIGRKITINTESMKYGLRRGYQLFDAILEG